MYDHVLFPTDGSKAAKPALKHAIDVTRRYGGTLHVLYIVDTGYPFTGHEAVNIKMDDVIRALEKEGEDAVADAVLEAERAGLSVESAVVKADKVATAILDRADEVHADLIVMGTHGRTGLRRFLLGSVTEEVLRIADVPVMTVRSEED